MIYYRILHRVVLYRRTLLLIHSIYIYTHESASADSKLPVPPFSQLLDNHKCVLYVCESVSVL